MPGFDPGVDVNLPDPGNNALVRLPIRLVISGHPGSSACFRADSSEVLLPKRRSKDQNLLP
jgi:hypothetical protein